MDKKDDRPRRYLAERCELLGAIRLPNNAFLSNAGTDITTDLVILQKLEMPRQLGAELPLWVQTDTLMEQEHTNSRGGDPAQLRHHQPLFPGTHGDGAGQSGG